MNDKVSTTQEVIDSLITIEDYVDANPTVYFACKALNYRTYHKKYDGNRPLSVYVDWNVRDGKLDPVLVYDNPLDTIFILTNLSITKKSLQVCRLFFCVI